MIKSSILFVSNEEVSNHDLEMFIKCHDECLPDIKLKIVDFFSSKFEDLQLVSKYRVVSLPTYVGVANNSKALFRIAGRLPTSDDLSVLTHEDIQ